MSLKILPLGIGDGFSQRWYSTCALIGYQGQWLLIDCPHPIRKMMAEASERAGVSVDLPDLTGVVVTHLHGDHVSGLESLGFFYKFGLGRKAPVWMADAVKDELWSGCLSAGMRRLRDAAGQAHAMALEDYFDVGVLPVVGEARVGPFTIRSRFTKHHIPTTALRIEAGGQSIGWSADTCFDPDLLEWLFEADLVVHETNLGTHTPYADLANLSAERRARMRLVHVPDAFEPAESKIEVLEQGVLVAVPSTQAHADG